MKGNHYCRTVAATLFVLGIGNFAASAQDAPHDAPNHQNNRSDDGVTLNDGQILQVVNTLNDAEIKQAKEALDQSKNADVKQVAEMILADHEKSNEQLGELLKGDINRNESPLNEMLKTQAEDTHESLQDLEGVAYDCSYLRVQVAQHEMAIETAETRLMTDARDAGVKQFLTAMGPKLEHHLEMAKAGMAKMTACQ